MPNGVVKSWADARRLVDEQLRQVESGMQGGEEPLLGFVEQAFGHVLLFLLLQVEQITYVVSRLGRPTPAPPPAVEDPFDYLTSLPGQPPTYARPPERGQTIRNAYVPPPAPPQPQRGGNPELTEVMRLLLEETRQSKRIMGAIAENMGLLSLPQDESGQRGEET